MRAAVFACISLLTACRLGFDEIQGAGDGSGSDDGPVVTPPVPGVARVTVLGEDKQANVGQPIAGAYVVAIEADGTTTTARTAADGTASIDVLGNTAVHVARPVGANEWALSSFRAINDGARIIAGGRPPIATSASRSVTVDLPAFPAGYTEAWITGPRGCLADKAYAAATSISVLYNAQCEGQSVELFALSYDIHVPLGTVTLTEGTTIDRTAAAWIALDKVDLDYVNVPPEVTSAYAFINWPTPNADQIPIGEGGDVPDVDRFVGLVFDIPAITMDASLVHAFESPTGVRILHERLTVWPGVHQVDASMLPPPPPALTLDTTTQQIQWDAGAAPDADVYWSSSDITNGSQTVHWNAFGPAGATQATFPALPAELAMLMPDATSTWSPACVVLAGLSEFDYAGAIEIVDRDIFWWWSAGAYMPPGTVSLVSTSSP